MNNKVYLIGPTESILTKRGNRFPNIADFLESQHHKVIYYASNYYHAEKRFFFKEEIADAKLKCKYNLNVVKVLGYKNNISPRRVISNFLFSIVLFFKLIRKVNKYDTILIPSRPVELIYFVSLLNRIKKTKIIIDIQDVWPDALQINNKIKKRIFTDYCNLFLYPSLKHYTNSFHVAPSFLNWLHRYSPKTPSSFIPLGWENERWRSIDFKENTGKKQLQIVCIAQLQYQIDIMPVIESLKSNSDIFLTIIGEDGTGERYDEVYAYIKNNKIANVDIIGKVDRDAIIDYLKIMDIGVLPMITSSIPNKIFDYIAAFLPIIVLGENDSSRFVLENNIGWSCNYDSESFSHLLNSISESDIITRKRNLRDIRDRFSRNELHQEILEIIQ